MKTTPILLSAAALLALLLPAPQAQAGGEDALIAVGGIITGVILAEVLDDDDSCHHRSGCACPSCRPSYSGGGPTIVIQTGSCPPRGHYVCRRVRVWVPGRWHCYVDPCGRQVRSWIPGYSTWREERVWVPDSRSGHGFAPGFHPDDGRHSSRDEPRYGHDDAPGRDHSAGHESGYRRHRG